MAPRIYVTRAVFDEALFRLRREAEVEVSPDDRPLSKPEVMERLRNADGAMTMLTDPIDRELLQAAPRLKITSNVAVGFNNVDTAAATELGVMVTNTPGVLTETTADFAWALLMAVARRVVEADVFARSGKWKAWSPTMFLGCDVYAKTIGIIGLGRIGQAVARRARGFNMNVIFHNPRPVDPNVVRELGATAVSFDELLHMSDFISLHVPLNAATTHLLDERAFSRMKPSCIVVNTARGPVVDEKALARALKDKQIAGAGLDVFEREPEIEPELIGMNSVVLAPHIGSGSYETRMKMCMMAADNLLAWLKGEQPPNLVNPEVWNRRRD
jgi:glyoxylate reductase